jgi:hypothetical protein
VIPLLGVENEIYGTYIWSFSIAGVSFDVWQEYALYFTLPMSFLGFLVGNLLGEESRRTPDKEASA